MAHQKHTKLTLPLGGKLGRNEVGLMGAPCGDIKALCNQLIKELSNSWSVTYVDADHHAPDKADSSALTWGAQAQYTNKISFGQLDLSPDEHRDLYFNDADLVLVNGNHFKVDHQIVYLHPKKSLEHKLEKLTNVIAIVMDDEVDSVPAYLTNHFKDGIPTIYRITEIRPFLQFIDNWLLDRKPRLNGLVLTGGKSTRMEKDKGSLNYHGTPQYDYMYKLLEPHCEEVFLSCRDELQAQQMPGVTIIDTFKGLGPYGGILSAFRSDPNAAWLVVAVDLPFLDEKTIDQLVEARNIHKTATCFIDRHDQYPEPLITIWEPRAYPTLLKFLSKGYSCPRKVLLNSPVEIIVNRDKKALTNINTPEEHEYAIAELTKAT